MEKLKQNINQEQEKYKLNLNEPSQEIFKVIFDNGKPYEEVFKSEEELKKGLKDFYERNKDEDDFYTLMFRFNLNINER